MIHNCKPNQLCSFTMIVWCGNVVSWYDWAVISGLRNTQNRLLPVHQPVEYFMQPEWICIIITRATFLVSPQSVLWPSLRENCLWSILPNRYLSVIRRLLYLFIYLLTTIRVFAVVLSLTYCSATQPFNFFKAPHENVVVFYRCNYV